MQVSYEQQVSLILATSKWHAFILTLLLHAYSGE